MTAFQLQESLKTELEKIFSEFLLKNIKGNRTKLNIFMQELPKKYGNALDTEEEEEDESEADFFPYIVIKLTEGESIEEKLKQSASVLLLIGNYDNDPMNQGHKDIQNMIQKIYERFERNNILDQKFLYEKNFTWVINDEDAYPYFFGGIQMSFSLPKIKHEWR